MIKVEHVGVWGFEAALRGMRNPMNSWGKADSTFSPLNIGDNDLKLMTNLYKGGTSHRKYLRQIIVSMDITAPLYWWKEFDTYKVGTVANSCSTMHKIQSKPFTVDDFSHEHLMNELDFERTFKSYLEIVIEGLNEAREKYIETKDKFYWWQMIQLLPTSYNQKRTVTLSYEVIMNILDTRRGHKLDEWRELCKVFEGLPYVKEIRGEK